MIIGGDGGMPGGLALSGQARIVNQRTTAEVACPRSMVGRVIGKNGETIKALQLYTNALIQIDQSTDPTRVTISGTPQSLELAISMVTDICKGTFKGFALLRQLIQPQRSSGLPGQQPFNLGPTVGQQRPVYAPGYGLIPPSQLYGADASVATTSTTLINPGAGGITTTAVPTLIGGRPLTLQLPPGYQYATMQHLGGAGATVVSDGTQQVLVQGLGSTGIPTHHLTGPQLLDSSGAGGATLLSSVQLPMQQVYQVPAQHGGGFSTQTVTYAYPPEFLAATGMGGEQLGLYQQQDGTLLSLGPGPGAAAAAPAFGGLPAQQQLVAAGGGGGGGMFHPAHAVQAHAALAGTNTGKAVLAAQAAAGRPSSGASNLQVTMGSTGAAAGSTTMAPRWSSGSGWVDMGKVTEPSTIGQVAVSELLGPSSAATSAVGTSALGGSGVTSGQQLVQVIGPEGKVVSYYHLGPSAAPPGLGSEHLGS